MSPSVIYKVPTLSMRMISFKEHLNMQPKKINKIKMRMITSIKMARSTTTLVTYPRTRLTTPRATDDDPMSTSIYQKIQPQL
jgi:hypothetical protein